MKKIQVLIKRPGRDPYKTWTATSWRKEKTDV